MNGRCETDPFDQAVNVCGMCFGEYCDACLVTAKGRKHPICRECAIVTSGVRAGAKIVRRGSKKTAKQRREELQSKPRRNAFRYFDDEPVDASPAMVPAVVALDASLTEPDAERESEAVGGSQAAAGTKAEASSNSGSSAIDKLDFIRTDRGPAADSDGVDSDRADGDGAEDGAEKGEGRADQGQPSGEGPAGTEESGADDELDQSSAVGFRSPRPFIRGEITSEQTESFRPRPFIHPASPAEPTPAAQPAELPRPVASPAAASAAAAGPPTTAAGRPAPAASQAATETSAPAERPVSAEGSASEETEPVPAWTQRRPLPRRTSRSSAEATTTATNAATNAGSADSSNEAKQPADGDAAPTPAGLPRRRRGGDQAIGS